MKNIISMAVLFTAMFVFIPVEAQNTRSVARRYFLKDSAVMDSTAKEKADVFYDSLKHKHYNTWLSRTLAQMLIVGRVDEDYSTTTTKFDIAQQYFGKYSGMTISKINIRQLNVFENRNRENESWGEKFINSLHILTDEKQLWQNLLFKEGDKLNPYNMAINESLLRSLPYLSTVLFNVEDDPENPGSVIVNILARDNWTISGNIEFKGAPSMYAFDRNFLGTGNKFTLKYYFEQEYQSHGLEAAYSINNLWGTFADVDIVAGVGAANNTMMITANRPFILPDDHIFGFTAGYQQRFVAMNTADTTILIHKQNYGAWYGYSFNIDQNQGTNMYVTAGFDYLKYNDRPVVTPNYSPYYHNRKTFLVSLGFARQNFFQGNMIYGYGRMEDIPYGYKFDITAGLEWSEFHDRRHYYSLSAKWGEMTRFGYFNVELGAAAFWGQSWTRTQGMFTGRMRYFSPLFSFGNLYMRQFFNVEYMSGHDRFLGERELLGFTDRSPVRGIRLNQKDLGPQRFTMSAETVFFTPIFLYHFRFAFYGWGDVGWLGYNRDVFRNQMYGATGLGVRIRNERLIFNSLSIRLGYIFNRSEYTKYNPIQFTVEQMLNMGGFAPGAPKIMPYE